jgi:hypothetical protein
MATFEHRWYQRLSDDDRRQVDAWFAARGLTSTDVKEARIVDGEPGCELVVVLRRNGMPYAGRSGAVATETRSFDDRPAAMQ